MRKEIFQHMSSWSQLFFLCLFAFIGLIFLSVFSLFIAQTNPQLITNITFLKSSVVLQSIILFFLPACLCAYLFHQKPCSYLKIDQAINRKFIILSLIVIIAIQPLISYTSYLNNIVEFPQSMKFIEYQMRVWEESAQALTEKLLVTNSILGLIINILIVGVVAGIAEEFFFRGCIQQIINKITSNSHLAIWITAFVFSAIHFQFFGFIPRLILGALLGYLLVWSGNLWISVIVHIVNNTLSVLTFHFFHYTDTYNRIENIGTGETWWTTIMSIFVVGFIVSSLFKEYRSKKIDNDYTYF